MPAGPGQVSISSDKAPHDMRENAPQFRLHLGVEGSRREREAWVHAQVSPLPPPSFFLPSNDLAGTRRPKSEHWPTSPGGSRRLFGHPGKPSPDSGPCATMCPVCRASSPTIIPQGTFPTSAGPQVFVPAGTHGPAGESPATSEGWGGPGGAGLVPGVGPGPCPSRESLWGRLLLVPGGSPQPRRRRERCPALPAAGSAALGALRGCGRARRGAEGRGSRRLRIRPAPRIAAGSPKSQALPYRTAAAAPRCCIPANGRCSVPGDPGAPRWDALPALGPSAAPPRPPRARPRCPGGAVPRAGAEGRLRGRGSAQRRQPGQRRLRSLRRPPSLPVYILSPPDLICNSNIYVN